MYKKIIKSISGFMLVFVLTLAAITGFSKLSQAVMVSQKEAAQTAYIASDSNTSAQVKLVVNTQTNLFPSIAAFVFLTSIPVVSLIFVLKKHKNHPNFYAKEAQRYSPKKEITFSNNTLSQEYTRSRM